jgi:hypothetical protein
MGRYSPCATGNRLTIKRLLALTQPSPFSTQGASSPKAHEKAFDRQAMIVQQLDRDRADLAAKLAADVSALASSKISGTASPNLLAVTATNSTSARTLSDRFGEVINVMDYGAKCDWNGATGTDDTGAVQHTLDLASGAHGRTVLIPARCKVTPPLTVSETIGIRITGYGAETSALVARGPGGPVLKLTNVRDSFVDNLAFEGWAASPLPSAIESVSAASAPYVNTNNTYTNVRIGASDEVGIIDGIRMTATLDHNNDLHNFINCRFLNYSGAAISIEHSNSLAHRIIGGNFSGPMAVRAKTGSFNMIGSWIHSTDVDFELGTSGGAPQYHPTNIIGVQSESNARILRTGTDAGLDVIISAYDRQGGVSAGGNVIDFRSPGGSLTIDNSRINLGQPNNHLSVSGVSSVLRLLNNRNLGFTHVDYYSRLISFGNYWSWGHGMTETQLAGPGTGLRLGFGDYGTGLAMGSLHATGLTLSAVGDTVMKNLRGSVTLSGAATFVDVDLAALAGTEPGRSYAVSLSTGVLAGTPAAGSLRASWTKKRAGSFRIVLEAAPGTGNSVGVDWQIIR